MDKPLEQQIKDANVATGALAKSIADMALGTDYESIQRRGEINALLSSVQRKLSLWRIAVMRRESETADVSKSN